MQVYSRQVSVVKFSKRNHLTFGPVIQVSPNSFNDVRSVPMYLTSPLFEYKWSCWLHRWAGYISWLKWFNCADQCLDTLIHQPFDVIAGEIERQLRQCFHVSICNGSHFYFSFFPCTLWLSWIKICFTFICHSHWSDHLASLTITKLNYPMKVIWLFSLLLLFTSLQI